MQAVSSIAMVTRPDKRTLRNEDNELPLGDQ